MKKEKKTQQELDIYDHSDDYFAYIAGYTSGGAPYGITWEELGIEPYAPHEEIMAAYDRMEKAEYEEVGDCMEGLIRLRELNDRDIILFKKWLYSPHVAKWYHDPLDWINEVEKRNSDFIWLNHFIVEYEGKPIGFCQYYECINSGESWHGSIKVPGTYSIDYMIGEAAYLRKGIGKQIIRNLIAKIMYHENAKRIIVQPESENKASCNTLLSCGFEFDIENEIYLHKIRN